RSKRDWSSDVCSSDLTDVRPFKPPHQPSFRNRLADAHPHSPVGSAHHQGIKLLADARLEQHGGGALARLALDLRGIAFLLGAVRSEERRVGKEWRSGG